MVDWLLENAQIAGFSTMNGFGHGSRPSAMSLMEQVAGRQRRVIFMVETMRGDADAMIRELKRKFSGAGVHYMMMPLLDSGSI